LKNKLFAAGMADKGFSRSASWMSTFLFLNGCSCWF